MLLLENDAVLPLSTILFFKIRCIFFGHHRPELYSAQLRRTLQRHRIYHLIWPEAKA